MALLLTFTRHTPYRIEGSIGNILDTIGGASYNNVHVTIIQGYNGIFEQVNGSSGDNFDFTYDSMFVPDTNYTIYFEIRDSGLVLASISDIITIDSATSPSSSQNDIYPRTYPIIKNQRQSGTCVAHCLTTAMEYFRIQGVGIANREIEVFGASYLYGTDSSPYEEMNFLNALNSAKNIGSPRWELVGENISATSEISKSDAQQLYNSACTAARNNAVKNALNSYQAVDFYNGPAMVNALITYGCIMFNFNMPDNFYETDAYSSDDGVALPPDFLHLDDQGRGVGHCMLIIGLTEINGKFHWVAQNSWGSYLGGYYSGNPLNPNPNTNRGYVFIPYDWGSGIDAPDTTSTGLGNTKAWVVSTYALSGNSYVSESIPDTPTLSSANQNGSSISLGFSYSSGNGVFAYTRNASNYDDYTSDKWMPVSYQTPGTYGILLSSSPSTVQVPASNTRNLLSVLAYDTSTYRLSARSQTLTSGGRPANWAWISNVTQGATVPTTDNGDGTYNGAYLTAAEWNDFTARIVDFMVYKNYMPSNTQFVYPVTSGNRMYLYKVRQALEAISYLSPPIPVPNTPVTGDNITAAFFNGMKDSLNSIV